MVQIVLLDSEHSIDPGELDRGGIVSVYEDDIVLGPSYDNKDVLRVEGITIKQFWIVLESLINVRIVHTVDNGNTWNFGKGEEGQESKEVWHDGGGWKEKKKSPRFFYHLRALTGVNRLALGNVGLPVGTRLGVLSERMGNGIKLHSENTETSIIVS